MKIKSILSALLLMVSSVASAQYLNVKLEDGTYRSFKTTPNMKVSFGDKAGAEVTEYAQIITVGGHTVTVKLADDTPTSEVMLSIYVEDEKLKIEAFSKLNHGLWCSMDDNGEDAVTNVSNGFHTFTLSDISKDVVVTVGYINVWYDMNNSGMDASFTGKPDDIKKVGYNNTITEPDRLFSDKYGFRGWYMDKECTEAWNFSTIVTKSMTLYAKWAEDPTGTQINGHDYVKLAGYYWATENEKNDDYFSQDQAITVAKSWGSEGNYTWTLPSETQWQTLLYYCDWEWTGSGYLVKGRADNYESDHRIYLPAAGYNDGVLLVPGNVGEKGYYWSSDNERYLGFNSNKPRMEDGSLGESMSVRPVSE